jgi:hypothetical protein
MGSSLARVSNWARYSPDERSLHEALTELLSGYPQATGWTIASTPIMTFTTQDSGTTTTTSMMRAGPTAVWLTWTREEDGHRVVTALEALADEFNGEFYFRPGIGTPASVPSPLITWWAVLLGLSSFGILVYRYTGREGLDECRIG